MPLLSFRSYISTILATWYKKKGWNIPLIAVQGFIYDQCYLRASALTFYSLLSVVPFFALIFGIAKGFQIDDHLREVLLSQAQGQEVVLEQILIFANSLIEQTKGDVVAGVGILLLFWTVIRLLANIEEACGAIWRFQKTRSWKRTFADYMSLLFICPILLITSSSLTLLVLSYVENAGAQHHILQSISPLLLEGLYYLPYFLTWGLFTFLYLFIPNTSTAFMSALLGGSCASVLYQSLQWVYLHFQIGAARYGAVYGSFAALPLFLIWLQISWMIFLFGAEISFAHQYRHFHHLKQINFPLSFRAKRACSFAILLLCIERFQKGLPPLRASEMAQKLNVAYDFIRLIIDELILCRFLVPLAADQKEYISYQIACDPSSLTVDLVSERLLQQGNALSKEVEEHIAMHFPQLTLFLKQRGIHDSSLQGSQPLPHFLQNESIEEK